MKAGLILCICLVFTTCVFAQQNMKLRTEEFKTIKNGKLNTFSEWAIISIKNRTDMYVLFANKDYNLSFKVKMIGEEKVDKDGIKYLHLQCTEADGTVWTANLYNTTMYLYLNKDQYYLFENLKEY